MVQYISFDAVNRSGNKILSDARVRRASGPGRHRPTGHRRERDAGTETTAQDRCLVLPVQIACA